MVTEYGQIDALNATFLKGVWLESPKHALYHKLNPKESPSLNLGHAEHMAVFEPDRFEQEYVVWTGGVRRGKVWEAFQAKHKNILTEKEFETVLAMAKAVREDEGAKPLIDAIGDCEKILTWTHQRTGKLIKNRLDKLILETEFILADLKTTQSNAEGLFSSFCARYGYDIQMALYRNGVLANYPAIDNLRVVLIAVETSEPYDVSVYELTEEVLLDGETKYERAIDRVIECEKTGVWPGRTGGQIIQLHMPQWASPDYGELEGVA